MQLMNKVTEFMKEFRHRNSSINFIWMEIFEDESGVIETKTIHSKPYISKSNIIISFCTFSELEDLIDNWEW